MVVSFIIAFVSLTREKRDSDGDQESLDLESFDTTLASKPNSDLGQKPQLQTQALPSQSGPNLNFSTPKASSVQAQNQQDTAASAPFPWEQQATVDLGAKPETSDDQGLKPTDKLQGMISLQDLANKREI